jgi:hypothetical protein
MGRALAREDIVYSWMHDALDLRGVVSDREEEHGLSFTLMRKDVTSVRRSQPLAFTSAGATAPTSGKSYGETAADEPRPFDQGTRGSHTRAGGG